MAETRSFSAWKSEVVLWLMSLPSRGRRDTYDFDQQRNTMMTRLEYARINMLPSILIDLHRFCDFWDLEFPSKLLPSEREIREWFKRGD